ncbi:porin [Exercitatus varius]|uniref:Porin n=1 Tax=Exercitatus varius TaxID=67857 RepID=A0AAW6QB78_9PAST|nr:porin [Exercitatus varius]MDG2950737.1 porin [Exercitatus varius]
MKKTLVALAVAAAAVASTANAAVVYEQDGAKVELSGSFRMFLGKVGDERGDLKNNDSRVYIKANQDLGNGLSAFAGYQIRFTEDNNSSEANHGSAASDDNKNDWGSPSTHELYAGIAHQDVGRLAFGRQQTTADDVLQDATYFRSGKYGPLTTRSDKSIKFKSAEWNGFQIGADYLFGHEKMGNSSSTDLRYKNGYGVTAFYHYDIDENQKLEFAAGYTQDNYDDNYWHDTRLRSRAWLVHGSYTYGPYYLALNYGQTKDAYDDDLANFGENTKGRYAMVDARYQFSEPSALFFQWERKDVKFDNETYADDDWRIKNRYQVGVDYKLHKNVITYAMYEQERTKFDGGDTEKDNIYGVGLRVFF